MNKALADYLAELESRRYSWSRLAHVRRTIEMLTLYLKEAHHISDWRALNLTRVEKARADAPDVIDAKERVKAIREKVSRN